MLEETVIHRRTAMVIIRHGDRAADFAAMIARELAKVGDAEESQTWWSVSEAASKLLSNRAHPVHPEAA